MRNSRRTLLAASVLATTAAVAPVASAATPSPQPSASIDALYVVNATSGSFDGRTLTLHGVAPSVAWFADRPERASGVEPMHTATSQLFSGGQAQPNAALDLADDREVQGVLAFELARPRYDAHTRTLRYRVTRLPSLQETKLAHLEEQRTTARLPRTFHAAALFIDDGAVPEPDPTVLSVPWPNPSAASSPTGALLGTEPNVVGFTDANFQDAVIARSSQMPVVVDFWAPWASPCRMLAPVIEQESIKRAGQMVFGKLDVDANNATAQQYNITAVPTTLVFQNGQVVKTIVGYVSEAQLDADLATLPPMS